jgi:hypothetical protein
MLDVRMTSMIVEIFNSEKRVASHIRQVGRGGFSTSLEHMPADHAAHLKMTPEKIMQWASRAGEKTSLLSRTILDRRAHPVQGYRAILGIMNLGDEYGEDRLERACGMALRANSIRYRDVKSILKEDLDGRLFDEKEEEQTIEHCNIRGAAYYGEGGENC